MQVDRNANLKNKAISGAKWTSISTVVVTSLQFVQLAVLGRLLNPSDFGLMGMVSVIIGLAYAFSDMGISNAIIYKQNTSKEQLSSLYWLNILAGIAVLLILWGTSPLVAMFYKEHRLTQLIFWVAFIFPVTAFGQQYQILLQKELYFNRLAKIEIISQVFSVLVAVISAFLGQGVFSLVLGQLANATIKSALLVILGWRQWPLRIHFKRSDLKGYIGFGLYQMGERTINYINSNIDYILIGSLLGAKPLGYYTFAYNLVVVPVNKINPIVTRVAFPVFSKIQDDLGYLKKGYLKVLNLLGLINFPLLFGLAATANISIVVLFGEKWIPSILLVQILAGVGLLRSIGNSIGPLLLAKGRADLGFKWNLMLMITQIPGIYVGLYFGGVIGVALTFLILQSVYTILSYFVLVRTLLGNCLKEYIKSMWIPFLAAGLMGLVVWMIGKINVFNLIFLFLFQIICGIVIYASLVFYKQKGLFTDIKGMIFPINTRPEMNNN